MLDTGASILRLMTQALLVLVLLRGDPLGFSARDLGAGGLLPHLRWGRDSTARRRLPPGGVNGFLLRLLRE